MALELKAPQGFAAAGRNGSVVMRWEPVSGASGYRLYFYAADEPGKLIKARYSRACEKGIFGFTNGKIYLVEVRAFAMVNGREVPGELSGRVPFVPVAEELSAQNVICLKSGESAQLKWERGSEEPFAVFSSDDADVASVDPAGKVTAKSAGTAEITIRAGKRQQFTTRVEVERDVFRGENRAVLMFAGDMVCSPAMQKSAAEHGMDFFDAFRRVREFFEQADFSAAVLEISCCDGEPFAFEQRSNADGSANVNAPSTFIPAAASAGIDAVITAANRNCTQQMFTETVEEIKRCGMRNTGTCGDSPAIFDVRGFRMAVIACNMIANSDGEQADGAYSREYFLQQMNAARGMGAEFVVAYMHWGVVESSAVRKSQGEEAHFIADSGADLIVGSHSHTVQRFANIRAEDGRLVPCAYSLGDLISTADTSDGCNGIILRVELRRADGRVCAHCSCIPVMTERREWGAEVVPVFPPHSQGSRLSLESTQTAVGKSLRFHGMRRRVLLCGSEQLDGIFTAGGEFRCSRTAMRLSPISLGCSKAVRNIGADAGDKLRLDLGKDIAAVIMGSQAEYIAVDFMSAAYSACWILQGEPGEEPQFFTDTKAFRQSGFFRANRDRLAMVKPPFGESVWKPAIRQFSKRLMSAAPSGRVILFRNKFSNHSAKGSELRICHPKKSVNAFLADMEEYFIRLVKPLVVDISGHYFTTGEECDDHEQAYYLDAYSVAVELTSGSGRTYISQPDEKLWFDRVMKYYANMTERSYFSWLLDMKCAADQLIAYTNAGFAAANAERILKLRHAGSSELSSVRDFFAGDSGAGDIIRAADIIHAVLAGHLDRSYEFFEPAFRGRYGIIRKMVRLLSIETGAAVNEENAELVFLLRGKPQLKRYISSLRKTTVDIWGSSVSRESANACRDAHIGTYIFKQPQILAFDKPVDAELPEGAEAFNGSRWRRRNLQDAFLRSGDAVIKGSDSGWIIVDFCDLIGRMTEFRGELFETDDFIRRTDFYKSIQKDCRECWLFERRDMKYCSDRITRFGEMLKAKYGNHIILIKTEPKDRYIDLDHRLKKMETDSMFIIKKRFISLCEERFATVTSCFVIDISRKFYASDSFPLGGADIVHYEDEFYRQAGAYISEIITGGGRHVFTSVDEDYILLRDMRAQR